MDWDWSSYIGCPVCKAKAGQPCVDLTDPKRKRTLYFPHPGRRAK